METELAGIAGDRSARDGAEPRPANWVMNAAVLWEHRGPLPRAAAISLAVGLVIAFRDSEDVHVDGADYATGQCGIG